MIAAGGPLYHASAPLSVYVSMFCHGSIYLLGFVTIGTCVCDMHDKGKLALGVTWVAIRAALLRRALPDLHAARRRLCQAGGSAGFLAVGAVRLLRRRPAAGLVHHSGHLPPQPETVSEVCRRSSGLIAPFHAFGCVGLSHRLKQSAGFQFVKTGAFVLIFAVWFCCRRKARKSLVSVRLRFLAIADLGVSNHLCRFRHG